MSRERYVCKKVGGLKLIDICNSIEKKIYKLQHPKEEVKDERV